MIVYGKNVAKEVLNSNIKISKIYISTNFNDKEVIKLLENKKVVKLPLKKMDEIVSENHQGIILKIEDYSYSDINSILDKNFIVILDHLEDPHNFGAIVRTCEAAGVDAIIIPNKRSVEVNSTVMKVSAGALSNVKIVLESNLPNTIDKLKDSGFWVYGTDMDKNSSVYTEINYDKKTALVIGSEGNGMSRLVKEKCDFIVNIPMVGKINSLNASVAAALVIYEVVRQKASAKNEI